HWRKIIVGDAFRLPSRDFNYYRDLALLWPLMLFGSVSVVRGFSHSRPPADAVYFHRALAVAAICLLLANERLLLVGISMLFLASRGLFALIWDRDWAVLFWLL